MKCNHFSPEDIEITKIIEANSKLPQLEKTCYKCGHKPCPSCEYWCDTFLSNINWLGNWEDVDEEDIDPEGNVYPPHVCCPDGCVYE